MEIYTLTCELNLCVQKVQYTYELNLPRKTESVGAKGAICWAKGSVPNLSASEWQSPTPALNVACEAACVQINC